MKPFKTITQKLIILGSLLSLSACGSSSAGLTITADDQTLSATDSAKFYYKSVNAGNVTLTVTTVQTVNGMPAGKDLEASISFPVQN